MGNIMDYISWRGDLTFAQSPFNEVDNLILACFSYVNLDGIPAVSGQKGIELKKLVKEFKKLHTIKELEADKSFIRLAPFMMFEMAESVRFGKCVIRNYVNEIVTEAEQQFSAVEIVLDDGTSYISFRGTDDTIIGWKEDFNLSTGVVPAQERAVEYMERISDKASGMLRVGGHSKGGNIAVYSAIFATPQIRDRIINVYNNDGPGFCEDILETQEYQEMINKVHTYIPQSSIIGRLMNHKEKYTIIESTQKGIMQHDLYSWQILGKEFITLPNVTNESEFIDKTIKEWLENVEPAKREQVINVIFEILNSTDAQTTKELRKNLFSNIKVILEKYKNIDPETKEMIAQTANALIKIVKNNLKNT